MSAGSNQWVHGLCGCFEDPKNALMSCCCGWLRAGVIMGRSGLGNCCVWAGAFLLMTSLYSMGEDWHSKVVQEQLDSEGHTAYHCKPKEDSKYADPWMWAGQVMLGQGEVKGLKGAPWTGALPKTEVLSSDDSIKLKFLEAHQKTQQLAVTTAAAAVVPTTAAAVVPTTAVTTAAAIPGVTTAAAAAIPGVTTAAAAAVAAVTTAAAIPATAIRNVDGADWENYSHCMSKGVAIGEIISSVFGVILLIMGIYMRMKIREKYDIPGSFMEDCLVTCCCSCCALAQAAATVDTREMGHIDACNCDGSPGNYHPVGTTAAHPQQGGGQPGYYPQQGHQQFHKGGRI